MSVCVTVTADHLVFWGLGPYGMMFMTVCLLLEIFPSLLTGSLQVSLIMLYLEYLPIWYMFNKSARNRD
jgi:hypothetical protein